MSTAVLVEREVESVVLRPRPYARHAGRLLIVPLLPKKAPLRPLPVEIWSKILMMAIPGPAEVEVGARHVGYLKNNKKVLSRESNPGWKFALVCKLFKDILHPLLYENCRISSLEAFRKFHLHLHRSDQKWDSLRRIQYSTPGRWVRSLDLHELRADGRSELYAVDNILTNLFPLLPFLERLHLNPSLPMSKRSMVSLSSSEGTRHMKTLRGIKYDATCLEGHPLDQDPLTQVVASCRNLEELEVLGSGIDDVVSTDILKTSSPVIPLHLPRLRKLLLLSTPSSDLLFRLLHSSLPSLCDLMITPYGDLAYPISLVSQFLLIHGPSIKKLYFHTPKSWPTVAYPVPSSLLHMLPNLSLLSIEHPLPTHAFSSEEGSHLEHQLECLWIPRPTASFRNTIQKLLPRLPNLKEVRVCEVRWARQGISALALETGFQAEMRVWRRILSGRSVKLLDADGRHAGM